MNLANQPKEFPTELPGPWHWDSTDLSGELRREVGVKKEHVLYGKSYKSVARRQDMDDFLFELKDGEYKYAVVHITWSPEWRDKYPITELYKDWNDLYNNRILPDSEGWED